MKYFVKLGLIILAVIFVFWFVGATLIHSHDSEVNAKIASEHPEVIPNVEWRESHSTQWVPETGIIIEEHSGGYKPDTFCYYD